MDIYQPKVIKAIPINGKGQAAQLLGKSANLPVGFHFIVDRRTLEPIQDAFDFLLAESVSPIGKPQLRNQENTSKANAEDLVDLLLYANSIRVPLTDFTEELIQGYADSMSETISPQTQKVYSDATILKRVSTAKRSLEYLQNQGRLKNRIDVRRAVVKGEPKLVFAPRVKLPKPPAVDALVKHIPPALFEELAATLGRMPSEERNGLSRDRLFFTYLANTGCRISEGLAGRCSDLPLWQIGKKDPLTACFIKVKAKGGHQRNVRLPIWLLEELDLYIKNERAEAVAKHSPDQAHDRIFVNHQHAHRGAGSPLSAANFRKIFRRAAQKAAERVGSQSVPSPHSCRHSFALFNYAAEKLNGNPDPGKTVQALLGHRDKATTDKIYLNASVVLEEVLSEADQSHLTKLLSERGL
ncbi:tyrosine-type recombinase/integrase [Pseudoxanthomonas sp. PXM03]|uniref:tyrosine-type recombinase/integrase n=1 Tax=Pseudoxanthomonas sp. PXM03 TaxID=2769284 RepID=UPI001786A1B2|nr:tyrosine-type recombinase/integrase [Pseudoxanthomonas sp. PXM03]MBD9437946.1 tyrosine-type recombinase/integrase [Pseudoxanthomonas sp. PXM03]